MEQFKTPNVKGAEVIEQSISLTSAYTLANQTALQKLFNSTPNGAVTLKGATTYYFECNFDLSGLSATSGNFTFGFLGTATFNTLKYIALAVKASLGTPTAPQMTTVSVATASVIVTSTTATTGHAKITGIIRCNVGGTLIPSLGLGITVPTAVVGVNSKFQIWQVGSNIQTNTGNWT
jgi:hypothetical protein